MSKMQLHLERQTKLLETMPKMQMAIQNKTLGELEMTIQTKIFTFFSILFMLIISYYLGSKLFELVDLFDSTTYQWTLKIAIFMILIIANFVIPYLVATDYPLNPLNGVIAMLILMIGAIGTGIIIEPFWTFLEPLIQGHTDIETPIQLILILVVMIFNFALPLTIALQEENIA